MDPLHDALYKGIQRGVRCAMKCEAWAATVTLIYAGMDAMAALIRPEGQADVQGKDFIAWADRYVDLDGVVGLDLWSARCAVLHTYGVESRMTREEKARRVGYVVGGYPPVHHAADVSSRDVLIEIRALAEAFFQGMSAFVLDIGEDSTLERLVEARARKLLVAVPVGWKEEET